MKGLFGRYPLVLFFLLAFAGFWLFLPLAALSPALPPAIGTFAPAIAAVLVTGGAEGKSGLQALLGRLSEWRVRALWYGAALGLPIVVGLVAIALALSLGSQTAPRIGSPSVASVIVFVFAAGEELGWRGFALPRLLARRSALLASLVLGAVHAIWHWPILLLPGQLLSGNPLLAHSLTVIATSILYTWLLKHTRGSALIATLFHGAINGSSILYQGIDPGWANWFPAAIWTGIALVVVLASGPQLTRWSEQVRDAQPSASQESQQRWPQVRR